MRRLFKVGSDRHDVGRVIFSWHPEGNFIASAGKNGTVQITDRHGDIVDEIPMQTSAAILALEWDKDGDFLAILQSGNGVVPLWSLSTRRVVPLETNLREPTFLKWSKTGPQLAVGTAKGNLLIYHKTKKQKIPIVGKHAKRISCGSWSTSGNRLVLGSEDKTLTVSNEAGDTLLHTELKYVPLQTQFTYHSGLSGAGGAAAGGGKAAMEDNMVSANLSGKSLYLYNVTDDKEDPMELTFAPRDNGSGCKYGDIVHHEWFDDNLLMIGFTLGHLQVVSTDPRQVGEEKFVGKFHPVNMLTFAYNTHLKRAATTGDDGVRIVDTREFKEIKSDYISPEDLEDGRVTDLAWSPDGQILTVGTSSGNVYNFLAKMSVLHATYKTNAAYLSSLREVSVVDAVKRSRPIDITLKLEPSIIALGAKHVAAGMNSRVYYHRIAPRDKGSEGAVVSEQEYVGTVREVRLNATFAVVLTDGKATLHPIEASPSSAKQTMTFPTREEGPFGRITCVALTDEFLYYGTEAGTVESFYLAEFCMLPGLELRIDNAVKQIYPNNMGTRVVVVDATGQVFLFNPVTGGGVNQSITRFEDAPTEVVNVLWDVNEKNVIIIYDGKHIHTYVYIHASMKGPLLSKLGPVVVSKDGSIDLKPDKIEVVQGNIPIMSIGGVLTCQTASGTLVTMVHAYFDQLTDAAVAASSPGKPGVSRKDDNRRDMKAIQSRFCQALALLKLEMAWQAALDLDKRWFWLALSNKSMELLNVELACRVYREGLGDAAMVMALQDCLGMEDKNQLAGQISLLFGDYARAQELFLASSRPSAALEMRRDLLQWDQALKLAQTLDASQVPDICVQYGQQLEFRGETEPALRMFDAALNAQDTKGRACCPEHLVPLAMAGVARCNLRAGNVRQGIRLCQELDDKVLYAEAGDILEQSKQHSEAAACFIKAENFERAAFIYNKHLIKADKGRIQEAVAVMEKVHNDQINSAFAKACVAAGRYAEACRSYERAKDIDKVIELKLRHLDQVQQAFDLVRQGSSAAGASLVADYCQERQDIRGCIEFLLLAGKGDEAFKVAQQHSLVEVFAAQLGDTIGAEDALQVAQHYDKAQEPGKAGRFYSMCGQHAKALKLFIQCGDREIDAAIEVVGKSQDEALTHQLIDFLVGEKDGMPKDPSYIYRLYMALKKYEEAAKTALIIARQEQDMGNYSIAHGVVFETIRSLEDAGMQVSLQLRQHFVLLHSYLRIKGLVKAGDHMGAAQMLLRVAQNISKFPAHTVNILTSTVVECARAGLKASAYEYAVVLMRPEHRPNIDANLKKKIEAIVRRRTEEKTEQQDEESACPVSGQMIPVTQLESPTTRDALPMCVVTGRHMLLDDWCFCPVSKCPALFSAYKVYIDVEREAHRLQQEELPASERVKPVALDPVKGKPVESSELKLATPDEAMKYIKIYNNVLEEKKKKKSEGEEDEEVGEEPGAAAAAGSPDSKGASSALVKSDRKDREKEKEREWRERRERKARR